MTRKSRPWLMCIAMLGGCHEANSPIADPEYKFVQKECAEGLAEAGAICGDVSIPENYSAPKGRRISLNIIVLKALQPTDGQTAEFDIEGGPGYAVTDSVGFYAVDGSRYRQHNDIVLADMRGTGSSNPLRCEAIERHSEAHPLDQMYPPDLVADCAKSLSISSDLRQYTTAAAAKDIDAIRSALGYRQLNLNALSYGSTLALRYVADYPQHVRTLVSTGTVPAKYTPPRLHASGAEQALRQVIDACRADVTCSAHYPDLWADLEHGVQSLAEDVRPVFLEKLRTMLYMAVSARRVPSIIHAVADGDERFLAGGTEGGRVFADGLYLSITCSESLGRIDIESAIAEAATTPFGAYRLQRQRDACARWPAAEPDPKLFSEPPSQVPALFISGAFDPVSPAAWTTEIMPAFPNGTHIVVPGGGHVLEGMSGMETCLDAIVLQFLESRSMDQIDLACVDLMDAGPFAIE